MVQSLVIGVDIGHHSIKAVVLKPAGDKYTLLGYQEITVSDDIFTDNHTLDYQKIVKKLKELKKGLPRFCQKVVIGIPDTTVISKVLQIDSELEINEQEFAIHQAFSHQSPFPSEELCLDYVPITEITAQEGAAGNSSALAFQVYATKKVVVESRSLALEKAGFTPILADVQSHSLVHLWQRLSQAYHRYDWIMVDVGYSQTSLCLDLVNKPPFFKQIAMGSQHLAEQREGEPECENQLSPLALDELAQKVSKQIQLFVSVNGASSVSGIWLCGGASSSNQLLSALVERCNVMCGVVDPFSIFVDKARKRHRCPQSSASFATAAGLALRGLNWLEAGHAA